MIADALASARLFAFFSGRTKEPWIVNLKQEIEDDKVNRLESCFNARQVEDDNPWFYDIQNYIVDATIIPDIEAISLYICRLYSKVPRRSTLPKVIHREGALMCHL